MTTTETEQTYAGYKNHATWNVVLWINNDEGLYNAARRFMESEDNEGTYQDFIERLGRQDESTPDGVPWLALSLDLDELDEMMKELTE